MKDQIRYRIDDSLQGSEDEQLLAGHMDRIRIVSGRGGLNENDVYVRSMWLASTQYVESDGLRFSDEALEDVARKSVGQSVIVGHDKSGAPIGRIYHAVVTERFGFNDKWVRAWFYWARSSNEVNGVNIRDNIDFGVWRGVSVSFRYGLGDVVKGIVKAVKDVLEASVVFRPADNGAELAGARADEDPEPNLLEEENKQLRQQVEHLQGQVASMTLEMTMDKLKSVVGQ